MRDVRDKHASLVAPAHCTCSLTLSALVCVRDLWPVRRSICYRRSRRLSARGDLCCLTQRVPLRPARVWTPYRFRTCPRCGCSATGGAPAGRPNPRRAPPPPAAGTALYYGTPVSRPRPRVPPVVARHVLQKLFTVLEIGPLNSHARGERLTRHTTRARTTDQRRETNRHGRTHTTDGQTTSRFRFRSLLQKHTVVDNLRTLLAEQHPRTRQVRRLLSHTA